MSEPHGAFPEAVAQSIGGVEQAAALRVVGDYGLRIKRRRRLARDVEQRILHELILAKPAHPHAEETDGKPLAPYLIDHAVEQRGEGELVVARGGKAFLDRAHGAVAEAQLEGERAACESLLAKAAAYLRRHRGDCRLHIDARCEVFRECHLVRYRLRGLPLLDGCHVAALRTGSHHNRILPEDAAQKRLVRAGQVPQRAHTMAHKLALGDGSHAAHLPHGQRREKSLLTSRVNDSEPTRLVHVGGDFRDRLRRAHAHRAGNTERFNARLDAFGDAHRMLRVHLGGRDVHERLIDAHLLHERGLVPQDAHDGFRHLAIAVEMPVRPDGVGAQPPCNRCGLGTVDAEGARFV